MKNLTERAIAAHRTAQEALEAKLCKEKEEAAQKLREAQREAQQHIALCIQETLGDSPDPHCICVNNPFTWQGMDWQFQPIEGVDGSIGGGSLFLKDDDWFYVSSLEALGKRLLVRDMAHLTAQTTEEQND